MKNAKKMKMQINALLAIQAIIAESNLIQILLDNAFAKKAIMMTMQIVYANSVHYFGNINNLLFKLVYLLVNLAHIITMK